MDDALLMQLPEPTSILVGGSVFASNPPARQLGLVEGQPPAIVEIARALEGDALARGECTCSGRFFDWSLSAPFDGGRRALSLRDVTTHRRRAEHGERYRLVAESAHDIVLFLHPDGRLLDANDAASRAYGYRRVELQRMTIQQLRAPSTREAIAPQMREALERGVIFETLHQRRDGTTFPVEVSSRSAQIGGETLLVSIVRDLTERQAMQARLVHVDRMAAVGTLAAGVAHEINNPLAYAITNLEVLARTLARARAVDPSPDLELAGQLLETAREGADRVRVIVRDLRTFSRADDGRRSPIDVRVVLDSCVSMASAELRHRARVVRDYGDVPLVEASEARLAQVFLNLLVNAAQAFQEADIQRNEVRIVAALDAAGGVRVEVEDNGPGFRPDIVARVFEPFVTSKPAGQGTGLGLFISRELVVALGGRIEVESALGRGTRMVVTLPAADDAPTSAPRSARRAPPGRSRVLVIDDEDSIGTSIRHALGDERAVVLAAGALAALALLEEDRGFDVILCDVVMPELDGLALRARVAGFDPELAARFVFMTGGALARRTRESLAAQRVRVLEKPFTVDELSAALARR